MIAHVKGSVAPAFLTFSEDPVKILEAVLTIALRPLIDGPVPAIVIAGNGPRSGKTMLASWLADRASQAFRGQIPREKADDAGELRIVERGGAFALLPTHEAEWKKALDVIALAQKPLVVFDGIALDEISSELAQFVTSARRSVRPLWKREFFDVPIRTVVILAGDGEVHADLERRSIVIRVKQLEDFPPLWTPPAFDDCVAVLLGRWRRGGFPLCAEPVRHGFEGWSRLVNGILGAESAAPGR